MITFEEAAKAMKRLGKALALIPDYKKPNFFIRLLLRIGFVSYHWTGRISWPFAIPPKWVFKDRITLMAHCKFYGLKPYIFRNHPGVIKWRPGRILPRRWGFGWLGFEFGDRGH